MWNEKVLIHIISSISNLVKIDHNSEEKGLFACICVAIDVSKPLKRMIKYVLMMSIMNVYWSMKILLVSVLAVGANPQV